MGGDRVIPFFRMLDQAQAANERDYDPSVLPNTPSQASLKLGFVLGQDGYGTNVELLRGDQVLPVFDMPVGRLIETAAEASAVLDAYMALPGGVLQVTTDPVVTGYDDMADGALAISQELMAGTGKTPVKAVTVAGQAYDLIRCKSPCAPETTTPPWTADALRAAVLGDRHQVMYLGGHFDQGRARAADDLPLMLAPEVAQSSVDLRGALIFGQGCHLAYNTVDQDRAALTLHPDWAQASARKGVVGFIGGTGYQYFGVRERPTRRP